MDDERPSVAPDRNKAGRPIWFVHVDGGVYRPVTPAGVRAMALASAWLVVCAAIGMSTFVIMLNPLCLLAMFGAGGAGLGWFALTVARHS